MAGLLFIPAAAKAQFLGPGELPPPLPGVMRVVINLNNNQPDMSVSAEERKNKIQEVRLNIYKQAKEQCVELTQAFDSSCKIVFLTVNMLNLPNFNNQMINMNGSAIYDLTPNKTN